MTGFSGRIIVVDFKSVELPNIEVGIASSREGLITPVGWKALRTMGIRTAKDFAATLADQLLAGEFNLASKISREKLYSSWDTFDMEQFCIPHSNMRSGSWPPLIILALQPMRGIPYWMLQWSIPRDKPRRLSAKRSNITPRFIV